MPTTIRATAMITDDEPVFFMLIEFSPQKFQMFASGRSRRF